MATIWVKSELWGTDRLDEPRLWSIPVKLSLNFLLTEREEYYLKKIKKTMTEIRRPAKKLCVCFKTSCLLLSVVELGDLETKYLSRVYSMSGAQRFSLLLKGFNI